MFTITGLAMFWGLQRFMLLDMAPASGAAALEAMGDGMLVLDGRNRVVEINAVAAQALGLQPAEAVGRTVQVLLARFPELVEACTRAPSEQEGVWLEREGERHYFDVRVLTPGVARPDAGFRVVVLRDITPARQAQEALAESEARYRGIVQTAPSLILSVAGTGVVTSCNRRVEAVLGYRPDEVVGRGLEDLVHPEDWPGLREGLAATEEADRPYSQEYRMMAKDGEPVHVCAHWALLSGVGDPGATVHIIDDLTDRRRLEAQYRQAQKMEAIGQLAGGVAHDFNNLLTVINGYTDFLRDELAREGRALGDVEEIKRAGERAAALTRQLLAFSRRQRQEVRVICLNEVIEGMVGMLERVLGERITLVVRLAEDLGRVRADRGQIEQVILNLVLNARDAMPEGGTLTLETANVELDIAFLREHPEARPGPHVRLSVTDTGVGMTPEVMSHLFEPFFTTKERDKGTGLGLATIYGIVRQTGGIIYAESRPGEGSTFRAYLPRDTHGSLPAGAEPCEAVMPRGSETILVVEDEESVRALTSSALRKLGYTVLEASGAAEALDHWRNSTRRPDLVVADMVMPDVNGPELIRVLRAIEDEYGEPTGPVPVLFMTGYAHGDHESQSLGGHVMQKPFDIADLARLVRQALDGEAMVPAK
jgi:PAS domain S-box-containing protein